jgi:hypothetical protein
MSILQAKHILEHTYPQLKEGKLLWVAYEYIASELAQTIHALYKHKPQPLLYVLRYKKLATKEWLRDFFDCLYLQKQAKIVVSKKGNYYIFLDDYRVKKITATAVKKHIRQAVKTINGLLE